jgi:hypothetical protein
MPGNASTAERSSIGRSPKIGETASPPKPRKKSKRPPCNTGAARHRSFGIARVGFDNERTGTLGYVSGKQLPVDDIPQSALYNRSLTRTVSPLLSSTISHRSEQAFNLARRRPEHDVAPGTRNPFDSIDSRMVSPSHSEMVHVLYTRAKRKHSYRGARRPNFVRTISWCLDRFRLYDGTSLLLMQ